MKHIMLDLETMGNAAIVAIGAVEFNPTTSELGADFEMVVNLNSSSHFGEIDGSTVQWWLQQSEEARAIFGKDIVKANLRTALEEFSDWLTQFGDKVQMWGNGSGFDCVILNNAYKACRMRAPWSHYHDRDVRTIVELGESILGINPKKTLEREGVHHSALDDAKFQAKYVSVIWQALAGEWKTNG